MVYSPDVDTCCSHRTGLVQLTIVMLLTLWYMYAIGCFMLTYLLSIICNKTKWTSYVASYWDHSRKFH